MRLVIAFASGLLFALGLGVSGMLQPAKVLGFLDVRGSWDPTLLGVMLSAIPTHFAFWAWRRGRTTPFGGALPARANHVLDARLAVGASLFGVGWGLCGVCPGPALTNLAAPSDFTLAVFGAIALGVALSFLVRPRLG